MKITRLEWERIGCQFTQQEVKEINDAVTLKLVYIDAPASYIINDSKLLPWVKFKLWLAKLELA